MRIAITIFPGSNCDDDTFRVVSLFGATPVRAWHKDKLPDSIDAVIVPGGFSYGDYLRAGAMAAHSEVMKDVGRFVDQGGTVLGICNGFQILCELGFLPGVLLRNRSQRFICRTVQVGVEGRETPFTQKILGQTLALPVAHAEGRYFADKTVLTRLEEQKQIVFRYQNDQNPNGSLHDIAGICSENGRVVGLMPHPERAAESILGNTDGSFLFRSLLGLTGKSL